MATMLIAGKLASRVDPRKLMAFGIMLICWSLYSSTQWTQDVSERTLVINIMVQGAGLGFVFIPLQVVAFATLDPKMRTDGTSLLSLFRNIGSAIGVSVTSALLAHNVQVVHAQLAEVATPFNRVLGAHNVIGQMFNPMTSAGAQRLDLLINQQATVIGYLDDFKLMMFTTLPALLFLLFMRRPAALTKADPEHAVME